MARMYPAELPISTVLDKAQQPIVAFYHALAQYLDDDFHVFYNCTVDGVELEHDDSVDFVILHNKYGFLGIEVFRGQVTADKSRAGGNQSGGKLKNLPYSQIRMVVHSFIFGLKERGIRFYIPAPCCVVFANHAREEFKLDQDNADYLPLFLSDFSDLQNKIISMMPVRGGHESNWSVSDAVERISPLIVFNNGRGTAGKANHKGRRGKSHSDSDYGRPKIIYVVRAIDVFLVLINILVLAAIVFFMPESFAQRVAEFLRN